MSIIQSKKVELSELFYDLVFVYAISNLTKLIHHLHHGTVEPFAFLSFILCLFILINTWMYQTVFINRYGANTTKDNLFILANMALVLILSNQFSSASWEAVFVPFNLAAGLLSFSLMLQYYLQYRKSRQTIHEQLCRQFSIILSIRTALLLASVLFPFYIGVGISITGIILGLILPMFIVKNMTQIPVSFAHLVERVSLIVIITFGESIIAIAPYFTSAELTIFSLLLFSIIAGLFFFYTIAFDHLINHHMTGISGAKLLYLHYPILIGMSFITVSLNFLMQADSNTFFVVGLLYTGLALFYLSILNHQNYYRYQLTRTLLYQQLTVFLSAFVLSLIVQQTQAIIVITSVMVQIMTISLLSFHKQQTKE